MIQKPQNRFRISFYLKERLYDHNFIHVSFLLLSISIYKTTWPQSVHPGPAFVILTRSKFPIQKDAEIIEIMNNGHVLRQSFSTGQPFASPRKSKLKIKLKKFGW